MRLNNLSQKLQGRTFISLLPRIFLFTSCRTCAFLSCFPGQPRDHSSPSSQTCNHQNIWRPSIKYSANCFALHVTLYSNRKCSRPVRPKIPTFNISRRRRQDSRYNTVIIRNLIFSEEGQHAQKWHMNNIRNKSKKPLDSPFFENLLHHSPKESAIHRAK